MSNLPVLVSCFRLAVPEGVQSCEGNMEGIALLKRIFAAKGMSAVMHTGSMVVPESVSNAPKCNQTRTSKRRSLIAVVVETGFNFLLNRNSLSHARGCARFQGHAAAPGQPPRHVQADDPVDAGRSHRRLWAQLLRAVLFERGRRPRDVAQIWECQKDVFPFECVQSFGKQSPTKAHGVNKTGIYRT